jgi:hypothetical protein
MSAKPLRSYSYPDGTTLDLTSSCAVTGPDQVGGLHFGMTYTYARLNGGPWKRMTARSLHSAWTLAGAALTAAEAFEAITGEDG